MDDPVGAAEQLAPVVAARAIEIEQARRLPRDLVDAMAAARLFRLCIPKDLDGLEAHPATTVRAIEALSIGDGAAGWCLMIGATTAVGCAYLADDEAGRIYGPADAVTGGVLAPRGAATPADGGYRLSGQWQWGSGSQHSSWLQLGAMVEGDEPHVRQLYVPAREVEIIDTWYASGLRGTGSNDLRVDDALVPDSLTVVLQDAPRHQGALYRFPIFGLLAVGVCAVALGLARAAIDEATGVAATKVATGARRRLAERPTTQTALAQVEAALGGARAFLFEAIDRAWEVAERGDALSLVDRARLRMAATQATLTSAEVVDAMYNLGGGTSVYESSPLQRYFRNVHTVTQHMVVAPPTLQLAGRVLLGLEVNPAEL